MIKAYILFELTCVAIDIIIMDKVVKYYKNRKQFNSLVVISIN